MGECNLEELQTWAQSGAMALTGRAGGPPFAPSGRIATFVQQRLAALGFSIPGLLGERAAYAGLRRRGPWSCAGATRALQTRDGAVALSLVRPSDFELLPALLCSDVVDEPWRDVADWAADHSTAAVAERMLLLGLPGGAIPGAATDSSLRSRPGVLTTTMGVRTRKRSPLVLDLSSMWAGPLAAHLLGLRGARVLKVESVRRLDGTRSGSSEFFSLLHHGHGSLMVDFSADAEILKSWLEAADVVIESSRARALRQLGIFADEFVRNGTIWLSITAEGRDSDAVGFGDDLALRGGLAIRESEDLLPVGDAIADPLAGVAAAAAVTEALATTEARLIDLSMMHLVAELAQEPAMPFHEVRWRQGSWWVSAEGRRFPVLAPRRRR
jgi:CoA-transferase family III